MVELIAAASTTCFLLASALSRSRPARNISVISPGILPCSLWSSRCDYAVFTFFALPLLTASVARINVPRFLITISGKPQSRDVHTDRSDIHRHVYMYIYIYI